MNEPTWATLGEIEGRFCLIDRRGCFSPFCIDFNDATLQYRQKTSGKSQPLAKAVAIKHSLDITVLDATAGLGQDARILASLGCKVIMVEQSELLAQLLVDGLSRAQKDPTLQQIAHRLSIIPGNVMALNAHFYENDAFIDVVYLDPMYPESTHQAKTNLNMQILQELLGPQEAQPLLEWALKLPAFKTVLKRPAHSPVLLPERLNYQTLTKTGRFDVYLNERIENRG